MDCDPRVNLFIGSNATGKSAILREIETASSTRTQGDDLQSHFSFSQGFLNAPIIYIPAIRVNLHEASRLEVLPRVELPDIRVGVGAYGEEEFSIISKSWHELIGLLRAETTIEKLIDIAVTEAIDFNMQRLFSFSNDYFNGHDVEIAFDKLRRIMGNDEAKRKELTTIINSSYHCAKLICPEVLRDETPKNIGDNRRSAVGILTSDNTSGEPLYIGSLSSGTQGTLLWIWALSLKMAHYYDWQEGWGNQPAILLIDEIENHLHPTWQRRVIPALLGHFPSLQIFATTHSPFVVAGLKAGQIHLLSRDENGVVTTTTNYEDIIGWTSDEILRTMMGVDDPTDDATAESARELRQLRQEPPRAAPEEEEQRQQRIQELRQKVDRDLLAGGPMARQKEIFEERFAKIVERYRGTQDLNQEGS